MKTHLLDSDLPIREGENQTAICGTLVQQAAFPAQSEGDDAATSVFHMASCYRCKKRAALMTHKYLYLLADGESVLNPEPSVQLEAQSGE